MSEQGKERRPKRANGEGGASQRANGTWQWRLSLCDGRRIYGYGKTQGEAKRECLAKAALAEQGVDLKATRQTLGDYLDWWLDNIVASKNAPKTARTYRDLIRLHVVPTLGRVEVGKLTSPQVQSLLRKKERDGLSPRTVGHIRGVLRTALNRAVKLGVVPRNVADTAEAPRRAHVERAPLTADEVRTLLATAVGDRLEAFWWVAVSLGLRRGELLGLRWADVDLDAGSLRVAQTIARVDGKVVIQQPKTERSRRTLALPAAVIAALRAHRLRQLEERIAAPRWRDSGLVFTTTVGTAIDPDRVGKEFKALLKRAGLRDQRVHDLRHCAATLMIANGLPVNVVSAVLGHAQNPTTLNVYSHVLPAAHVQAAATMDRLLG